MERWSDPKTKTISRATLLAAGQTTGDPRLVPVIGHLPAGSMLVSSAYDIESGDLHLIYRERLPDELPPPPPEVTLADDVAEAVADAVRAGPQPRLILANDHAATDRRRAAMVAHELIRVWRVATGKGPDLEPWDSLSDRQKEAMMGVMGYLADGIEFAESALPPSQARVEQTLRLCVAQAFNLKP